MKKAGALMPSVCSEENFLAAFYTARRGKYGKVSVMSFSQNLFENIASLRSRFISGDFKYGSYHYFTIHDPKCRTICAASFEERVIHHALINVCKPYFERNLIYDTYATRDGKGIYRALDRAMTGLRRYDFVAKLDIRKYFDSISHDRLMDRLRLLFKDEELLTIFHNIIDSYHAAPGKGVPIGNLTSQYLANQYLSGFDHYVKEVLHVPIYIRYMDDMLVFGQTKDVVVGYVRDMQNYIQNRLLLNFKPVVFETSVRGVSFLGYKISRNKILLNRRSKVRFKKKLRLYNMFLESGDFSEEEYHNHILPLIAYAKKAYTRTLRQRMIEENS